ncbi:uncharacterized protein [Ranitomeya imitator]|uniref:uncharacterized protein isoform X1 n=1 Tax=Ranitomeya imitator TaxID=111125 RepID=UPI0037E8699A
MKDTQLFLRKVILRKLHFKSRDDVGLDTTLEQEALAALEELAEEADAPPTGTFPISVARRCTTFPPFSLCPQIDIFNRLVLEDLKKISSDKRGNNLTSAQGKAIKELKAMHDVVIKPADKGGNVVIWPTVKYEKEAFRQLRDREAYTPLACNPLSKYSSELLEILDRALTRGILTKKVFEGLFVEHPIIPTFYLLPKVHKNAVTPPGRPIVSGIGGLCDPVCKFIEHYLQPLVESLPSYVRDTTDVLGKIDGLVLEPDMVFATVDVESLYTSIQHMDGLEAVELFLGMSNLDSLLQALILELLQFVLMHNFFLFKDRFFLQQRGTAMGAACAPSYANLFLGLWEREVFGGGADAATHVQCWYRYIDDVLMIWRGPEAALVDFIQALNQNNRNIRLTHRIAENEIDFLDIKIMRSKDGEIQTDVFCKETSVNALLHSTSAHTGSTIRAIPVGQFLRMRRICSGDEIFERQARDLTERFQDRGYSNRVIKKGYFRARASSRNQLLRRPPRPTQSKKVQPLRFISTYNNRWEEMREILRRHWSVLRTEPILNKILPDRPLLTARRGKSLKDQLVRSHYVPATTGIFGSGPQRWGCYPCGSCKACQNVIRATNFSAAGGGREFRIMSYISCSTTHVVYYATCACNLIYIGLTSRELRVRVREHVRGIIAAKDVLDLAELHTIPRHFRSHHACDPSSFKVRGIDKVQAGNRGGDLKRILAQMECRWIVALGTMAPNGLNEQLSFVPFL